MTLPPKGPTMTLISSKRLPRAGAFLLTLLAVLVAFVPTASADDALLAKIDKEVNKWKTLDYRYKMITTTNRSADKSVLKLRMRMKYNGKHNTQIIEISEPSDMKGSKVLTKSPTEMYIYLPAMRKVRRIASHVTEAGFLGTALSQKDMTLTRYAKYYTAKKTGEKDGRITLALTAKGDDAPYPKLELTVAKDKLLPTVIKFFNAEGKLIKREKRSQYRCAQGYCTPSTQKIEDLANGKTTVLYLKDHKVNPKLDKAIFSKRFLVK
jgi:outer membrane lipoprotein-sorting protein